MRSNNIDEYSRIGFMQGRLCPMVDGKIQAFPWQHWQDEFEVSQELDLRIMEWTIDQDRIHDNPLMRQDGREVIRLLKERTGLSIPSLTGDCFMQAPFWKAKDVVRAGLLNDFIAVVNACSALEIKFVVVPLVDNGSLEGRAQEDDLVSILREMAPTLSEKEIKVVFESDYAPPELMRLIERFEPSVFGINYDIGNSAALGYDPQEEISTYGDRILNVHVKDRELGGTTVPLGFGNADFEQVFACLGSLGYRGNYIMQTARAAEGYHASVLLEYRHKIMNWIDRHGA